MSATNHFDLSGLRAAVVGGTGVLGANFCHTLSEYGAAVTVVGRDQARGERVANGIVASGGNAEFFRADATERETFQGLAGRLEKTGGLDILVNAAGVNSATPFADVTDDEWQRLLDVNLHGVFRSCQVLAPLLAKSDAGGSIINISSASSGPPLSRVMSYGVAKAGVNNLTQYLARELAPQLTRVNALIPGFFPAEQNRAVLTEERVNSILTHTPMRRLGEPGDLDGALLWLASPAASRFVTGALIPVDGGFTAMTI